MTALLDASGLARSFGTRRAVDGVRFALAGGEALALFGPNGAGKTTLLRLLAGLLKPDAGQARIAGELLPATAARARIGLISHRTMLYDTLTARENVLFAARLYGLADPDAATQQALDQLRVADRAEVPVRALSRGLQQRVAIARAIVHEPDVLLADEPYTGLDEQGAGALTGLLRERRSAGAALVVVTHQLQEGLAVASHAAVMRAGQFLRLESTAGLDAARYATEYRGMFS
ncbi:MAG: heme ABC exporter ATP-binding protein CcmA [Gemmatimonadaceae bacterium]|nr:heme ABC exporter ATP-binding protein CcmA [Gemmatimonadaceae bacterium]MCW5826658.1 heme ABC exporter ATP-binding protein CcmA [Gemmatimonadaceae bacterium]